MRRRLLRLGRCARRLALQPFLVRICCAARLRRLAARCALRALPAGGRIVAGGLCGPRRVVRRAACLRHLLVRVGLPVFVRRACLLRRAVRRTREQGENIAEALLQVRDTCVDERRDLVPPRLGLGLRLDPADTDLLCEDKSMKDLCMQNV